MLDNILGKIILSPFSLLYAIAVGIRNILYDTQVLKSTQFNLPVISIGNLSVGGAGKTPHIEYLIMLLKDYLKVSTLSRGYKRKTKGFRWVNIKDHAYLSGDEPLQYKRKWPEIDVAVSESRNLGIPLMLQQRPYIQTVLLDDAFQHRGVHPGLNILLTTFEEPYTRDYLLPAGRLREFRNAADRADIIIVSKCPEVLSQEDLQKMKLEIDPKPHQQLYFSYYRYMEPYFMYNPMIKKDLSEFSKVIVLSAIANVEYFLDHIDPRVEIVHLYKYEDHHFFRENELDILKRSLDEINDPNAAVLTTEKDAMRLDLHRNYIVKYKMPIYVLPAIVDFHDQGKQKFDQQVRNYLLEFQV